MTEQGHGGWVTAEVSHVELDPFEGGDKIAESVVSTRLGVLGF